MNSKRTWLLVTFLQAVLFGLSFAGGWITHQRFFAYEGMSYPVFEEAYQLLSENGLKEVPQSKDREYAMIRGVLQAYNDPYTILVEPAAHELQLNQLEGKYGGIGVRIEQDEGKNFLLYPFPDSPAAKAGIHDGDRLLSIGELTVTPATSLDIIRSAIRGPVGESILVTVGRPPSFTPESFNIERAEIASPSTSWNLATTNQRVGIIHNTVIAQTTPLEIQKAIQELQNQGAQYFVLDLRSNGGGLVEAGIDVARLFLTQGPIVQQQFGTKPVETYTVKTDGEFSKLPLAVLVNHQTASAAEIIAGALQTQKRAHLIGTNTYGKNTIQLIFNLQDGSSLHVTSAYWWFAGQTPPTPDKPLQLAPDILLPDDASDNDYLQAAITELAH